MLSIRTRVDRTQPRGSSISMTRPAVGATLSGRRTRLGVASRHTDFLTVADLPPQALHQLAEV